MCCSYKEESEAEETDEDDIIEVSADAVVDYEDDDRETIEKVFYPELIRVILDLEKGLELVIK